jgi:diguanylate cyclase (GGDEF)-like protein/PAS domain S-box-containing protein
MSDDQHEQALRRDNRLGSRDLDQWENEGGSPDQTGRRSSKPGAGLSSSAFAFLDALPLGILITDPEGRIVYSNPAGQHLYGVPASALLGTHWRRKIDLHDRAAAPGRREMHRAEGRSRVFEARIVTGSGQRVWTRHRIEWLDMNSAFGGHIHTIEDISRIKLVEQARRAALEDLSRERERARVTLESIGDAVISTDAKGHVTYLNKVAENLTGWTREKAAGQPLGLIFKVVDTDSGEPIHDPADLAMQGLEIVQLPANCLLLRPDGSELAIEDSAAPILDKGGHLTGAVVIFRDRRLSRDSTARMAYLARHDALTGLLNRIAFAEHFEQAIRLARRHQTRVGLLFVDLDDFKQINDDMGHKVGDRLLRAMARRLQACVRSTDLVCRYGGDEFVVLLGEIGKPEDAARLARKMVAAAARPHSIQGRTIKLNMSIGISLYPDDGADRTNLLHRADAAMYYAKLAHMASYRFYERGMERSIGGDRPDRLTT